MAALISFPFRLALNGSVVTKEDDTVDYYAEELAVLMMTRPGERPQVPSYGVADPTFSSVDAGTVTNQVSIFGPPVMIVNVVATQVSESKQDIQVEFDIAGNPDSEYGIPDNFVPDVPDTTTYFNDTTGA